MFKKLSPTKVSEVLDFDKIIKELADVETHQNSKADSLNTRINELEIQRDTACVEADRARSMSKKITKFLGELA